MLTLVKTLVILALLGMPLLVITVLPRFFELAGSVPALSQGGQGALATPPLRLLEPTATSVRARFAPVVETPPPTLAAPAPAPVAAATPRPSATSERIVIGNTGGIGAVLRSDPVTGRPVASLREGLVLDVLERRSVAGSGDWVRVRTTEGTEGWVTGRVALPGPRRRVSLRPRGIAADDVVGFNPQWRAIGSGSIPAAPSPMSSPFDEHTRRGSHDQDADHATRPVARLHGRRPQDRSTGGLQPGLRSPSVSHGTTVATNALLSEEGSFPGLGLIVTRGFRHILEIARQIVPQGYGNSYFWVKPERIVPLHLVHEVTERLDFRGHVLRAARRRRGRSRGRVVPRARHRLHRRVLPARLRQRGARTAHAQVLARRASQR